jgi:hypothetical protein
LRREGSEAIMARGGEERGVIDDQSEIGARYARLRRRTTILTWVCAGSAVVAFTGNFLPDQWVDIPLAAFVVFLATLWPTYRLHARSDVETRRRGTAPLAPDRIVSLNQAPVLYLRSFEDDQRASRLKGRLTEEEHLASVLSQIGPFVAVGRPGEALPTVGASRVYLGDEQWQPTVEELLRGARLVIIRTGRTAGLDWEVERAVRLLTPERLVLLVDDARELRLMLAQIRCVYPQVPVRLRIGWRSIVSIRAFVIFDRDWRPTCLRVRGIGLYFFRNDTDTVKHATKRLARTLRPLFTRLGMTWQPPSPNVGLIAMSALAASIFLLAFIVDLLGF